MDRSGPIRSCRRTQGARRSDTNLPRLLDFDRRSQRWAELPDIRSTMSGNRVFEQGSPLPRGECIALLLSPCSLLRGAENDRQSVRLRQRRSRLFVRRLHLDQHTSFDKRIAAERFVAWPIDSLSIARSISVSALIIEGLKGVRWPLELARPLEPAPRLPTGYP